LIYNDEESELTLRMKWAFLEYNIKHFPWSMKEKYIENMVS
jgi:hypothetical protein